MGCMMMEWFKHTYSKQKKQKKRVFYLQICCTFIPVYEDTIELLLVNGSTELSYRI